MTTPPLTSSSDIQEAFKKVMEPSSFGKDDLRFTAQSQEAGQVKLTVFDQSADINNPIVTSAIVSGLTETREKLLAQVAEKLPGEKFMLKNILKNK